MTRPRPGNLDLPLLLRLPLWLYRFCASLRLAVVLIAVCSVVLAWATWVDSRLGTPAVQFGIYRTWWFLALHAALGLNVLCSALIRLPWKKRHVGFLITHLGILVLLFGCLLTWWMGTDAQLSVIEADTVHRAALDSQHFELRISTAGDDPQPVIIPFRAGPFNFSEYDRRSWFPWRLSARHRGVLYDRDGIELEVLDYYSDSKYVPAPRLELEIDDLAMGRAGSLPNVRAVPDWGGPDSGGRIELGVMPDLEPSPPRPLYGNGYGHTLPGGIRFAFWMTGSPAETEAFGDSRPQGPLGRLGQVVLHTGGRKYHLRLDELYDPQKSQLRTDNAPVPLGDTGLRIEVVELRPDVHCTKLMVHSRQNPPQPMFLDADDPGYDNQQDYRNGVFGSFWRQGGSSRVDIIQGADKKLYYRTWRQPQSSDAAGRPELSDAAELPTHGSPVSVLAGTERPLQVRVQQYTPHERPGKLVPLPLVPRKPTGRQRQVRVRLTVDGNAQQFWLAGGMGYPFGDSPLTDQWRVVSGDGRSVRISMPRDEIELGFSVRLREFVEELYAGSQMKQEYTSIVDVFARDRQQAALAENVRISMNRPYDFTDPQTGSTCRLSQVDRKGPWTLAEFPQQHPIRQRLDGKTERKRVYLSALGVNLDPGRGVKHAGSLMIVLGIIVVLSSKGVLVKIPGAAKRPMGMWIALMLLGAGAARAQRPGELDFSAWQRLPVFHNGRRMPLDSFARSVVRQICGKEKPTLRLAGALPNVDLDSAELAAARRLFPDDRPRKLTADELLFGWLVDSAPWEYVPLLHAEHEGLRKVLGVPLQNGRGDRLKFVSADQIGSSEGFREALDGIQRRQRDAKSRNEEFQPTEIDEKVIQLENNYDTYFRLIGAPARWRAQWGRIPAALVREWKSLHSELERLTGPDGRGELSGLIADAGEAVGALAAELQQEWFQFDRTSRAAARAEQSVGALAQVLKRMRRRIADGPPGMEKETVDKFKQLMDDLIERTGRISGLGGQIRMHVPRIARGILQNGQPLRMLPALDPDGLMATSRQGDQRKHPWLDFNAVIFGPVEMLSAHVQPQRRSRAEAELREPLDDVRRAFAEVRRAYLLDLDDPTRPRDFARAMRRFETALGTLGRDVIEPFRVELPVELPEKDLDKDLHGELLARLFRQTAYPQEGEMDVELHYNRFAPFQKSWIASLAAVFSLALSFGVIRRTMFWLGVTLLAVTVVLMAYGLVLRCIISGFVPVTNMYESVVFVALSVCLLGLWFTLLPVFWSGVKRAWQMTVAPPAFRYWLSFPWRRLRQWLRPGRDSQKEAPATDPAGGNWLLMLGRICIVVWLFHALTIASYGHGGERPIVRLWPQVSGGSTSALANDLLAWAVGLGVLVPALLYLPHAACALAASLVTVPRGWASQGIAEGLQQTQRRKLFAMVGALVGCLTSMVAYLAPAEMMPSDIGTLAPALHSNFWLAIHVLPITASYGAGALAWGLGNIALGYYLFGRYDDPKQPHVTDRTAADGRLPGPRPRGPEACATLASFIYRSILVAVLLLIAGTILGALWADVAWGRFWGWDNKEVWSLISILAYMIILHGRYAGWAGHFAMAAGAVLGMTSIVMAWYGVNFLLPGGLHSYGTGSGSAGQLYVATAILGNWLFVIAASVWYYVKTRTPLPGTLDQRS